MTGNFINRSIQVRQALLSAFFRVNGDAVNTKGLKSRVQLSWFEGHAVFEFIEARWGKEGIREYLFNLRKAVIGGGEEAYQESFEISADEFDQQFDKYLKDRFKPFRDKERPADYGRNLAPDAEKTQYAEALAIAPSPSGDLLAVITINRKDREVDVVLVSTKDGSVIRNLTEGFDKDLGFANLVMMGVLPLEFISGETMASLGLTGHETFTIRGLDRLAPRARLTVEAASADGKKTSFQVLARVDDPTDVEYVRQGGILQQVLRERIAAT